MAESFIRWKRGDYITLGKAVSAFNKKINELEANENSLYLPEKINYSNLKSEIMTRKRLNQIIKDLKNFQKDNSMDLIKLENGEEILRWEYEQLKSYRRQAINRINKELSTIDKEGKLYETEQETLGKANINYLKGLETAQGQAFKNRRLNILRTGNADYKIKKAITYKENYLDNYEKAFGNFDNFEILKEKLESIENPTRFFEYIQQNENLLDMFLYYDDEEGLIYNGGMTQDKFNNILENLQLLDY